MSSKIIFGVDPSLRATAVVWESDLFDDEARQFNAVTEQAVFSSKPPADSSVASRLDRLDLLATRVEACVVKNSQGVQPVVFIEGYSYASANKAAALGEFGSLLRYMLLQAGAEIYEIAPSTLKKFVTGNGNAGKDLMVGTVAKRYGFVGTNDEVDAFSCMEFGKVAPGLAQVTKARQQVVDRWKLEHMPGPTKLDEVPF